MITNLDFNVSGGNQNHIAVAISFVGDKGNPDIRIERGTEVDLKTCSDFCREYYRAGRDREIREAAVDGSLLIARENGCLVGFTTGISFSGFSVALITTYKKWLVLKRPLVAGFKGSSALLVNRLPAEHPYFGLLTLVSSR